MIIMKVVVRISLYEVWLIQIMRIDEHSACVKIVVSWDSAPLYVVKSNNGPLLQLIKKEVL